MTVHDPADTPNTPGDKPADALFAQPEQPRVELFAVPSDPHDHPIDAPPTPRASLSLVPIEPLAEPATPRPRNAGEPRPDKPRATGVSGRAYTLASVYCALQPMNGTKHAIATIVKKALVAGKWEDGEIRAALVQLAEEDRRVTVDTLRIALNTRHGHARKPRLDAENVVYVIGPASRRPVKIGTSDDPDGRLKSLQTGSPLELGILWTTPGGQPLEDALHKEFKHFRTHGEWFDFGDLDPVAEVSRAVKAIRKLQPVPKNVAFDHSAFARLPQYHLAARAISTLAKADLDGMDQTEFLQLIRDMTIGLRYHGACRNCGLDGIPPVVGGKEKDGRLRCEYECPDCGATWFLRHTQAKAA